MPKRSDSEWLEDRPDWIWNAYRLKLEVEYRRTYGTSFQLLFDRTMRSIHGNEYVATATYGNEGDLGGDGFLRSRSIFFAVYSPSLYFKLAEARNKMKADFLRFEECWQMPKQADMETLCAESFALMERTMGLTIDPGWTAMALRTVQLTSPSEFLDQSEAAWLP